MCVCICAYMYAWVYICMHRCTLACLDKLCWGTGQQSNKACQDRLMCTYVCIHVCIWIHSTDGYIVKTKNISQTKKLYYRFCHITNIHSHLFSYTKRSGRTSRPLLNNYTKIHILPYLPYIAYFKG